VGKAKGKHGETLAEALKILLGRYASPVSGQFLLDEVSNMGNWKPDHIHQGLMEFVINLPPSYWRYPGTGENKRFLFLREDGDYEHYQPAKHGRFVQGRRLRNNS